MIDRTTLYLTSGKGGNGAVSGRREKYVPRGGPDGGNGGMGGGVYLKVDPNMTTLTSFQHRHRFAAGHGRNGTGSLKHGKQGADITLGVPAGTQVSFVGNGSAKIADLTRTGQRICVAEGGHGGRGNASFANSVNRFPLLAEAGEAAREVTVQLDLKLLADVGIVGMPNAGKSSLLSMVSDARPRIADYPFTTLEPVLGVVEWKTRDFVMVDIPGLIEGAHRGVGLGHDFLQHVERTRMLVHVVDGTSEALLADYHQVREELRLFNRGLEDKGVVVALNKIDLPDVRSRIKDFQEVLQAVDVYPISASSGEGIEALLNGVLGLLDNARSTDAVMPSLEERQIPVLRPKPQHNRLKVVRDKRGFVVDMPTATRIAAMVDPTNWSAMIQFRRYLKRTGVLTALENAGVCPGDPVRVGKVEWEWE